MFIKETICTTILTNQTTSLNYNNKLLNYNSTYIINTKFS